MVSPGDNPSFIRLYGNYRPPYYGLDNEGSVVFESRLGTVPGDGRTVWTGAPRGMDPN